MRSLFIALALAASIAGCDEAKGTPEAASVPSAAASTAPSAGEPPAGQTSTLPASTSSPSAGDDTAGDEAAPKKEYACGAKGQPTCPMQGWMKQNIAKSVARANTKALADELAFIASHPVEGYDDWAKIAEAGVEAAKKDDLAGAKNACKACHKLHQRRYKEERRDAPWP